MKSKPSKSTRAAGKRRARRRRVRLGAPDASLTPSAGVAAVTELDRVLGVVKRLDRHIPEFKQRDRGLSAGQLLMSVACCQLTGGDHLVSLDRRRADAAGQELEPVPTPASTTMPGLAKRFGPARYAGIEAGIAAINTEVLARIGQVRRSALLRQVTVDIDATDVEVYGPTRSPPTPAPASAAPSPKTNWRWPWTERSTTYTGTPSS